METELRVLSEILNGGTKARGYCPILAPICSTHAGSGSRPIDDHFDVLSVNCFENRAPDHVVISNENGPCRIELEMTLLSWRNHFTCDIFAENGSAHIESLCKWGPSTFTMRRRVLPSGRPPEEAITLVQDDPTWKVEYEHFKRLCESKAKTNLSNDVWLGIASIG